jgi:polysaccharide pyruvyl transferase CsaB
LEATVAAPVPSPFSGVSLVARKHPLSLLWTILRADALAMGGGCLLQNGSAHKNRSLLYYLALLAAARFFGCPTYLVAGGLGPIHGKLPRTLTSMTLRSVRQISVRDGASFAFARTLGVPAERLLREPDPVLDIQPAAKEEIAEYLDDLPAGGGFMCVVPRPAAGDCHRNLSVALKKLWQNEGIYPLFFAFDTQHDPAVCQKLIRACGVGRMCRVRDERLVAGIFGAARGVISQRLHGLILSSVAGARTISLAYDERDAKLSSFAREAGQVSLGLDATPEQILKHAQRLIKQ